MNSKKFISLMSAAALAASSFTALSSIAAFASDGDTVIFSDNFNKYENTVTHQTSPEGIGQVLVDGTATARSTYSLGNATLYTTNRADDSSYYKSQPREEGSSDNYIETTVSRFSTSSRGAYIGFDAVNAESGKDVVLSFDMKETNEGGTGYDDAFSIGGTMVNLKTAGLNDGNWHKYKVVVTTSGTSVYVDGKETAVATGSDTSADDITFNGLVGGVSPTDPSKSASHPFGYITFGIDNLVIYTSADGAASIPPEAEDNNATPKPGEATPEPVAAKGFKAHSTAENLYAQNFNENSAGDGVTLGTEAVDPYEGISGMKLTVGSRASGSDNTTSAKIAENIENDNVLKMVGGSFASNGRSAKAALANNLDISGTENTAIMAFSFNLSPLSEGGVGQLYLLDNDTNVDGNSVARDILAVITTDGNSANYKNGDTTIGIDVEADTWNTLAVAVSADKYRVYLNGDYENPIVQGTKVNTGSTAVSVTHLPMLTTTNGKSSNSSVAMIDNVMAYTISSSFEKKYLPEETDEEMPNVTPGTSDDPTPTPAAPTPTAKPAAKAAPILTAHSTAESLYEQNFEKATVGEGITQKAEAQDPYTGIEGLSLTVGTKGTEGSDVTGVTVVENIAGDNVLKLTSGKFASNGRNAKIALANNLSIEENIDLTSIMAFAFKVSKSASGTDDKAQMYLIDNDTNLDGNNNARDILAVFTAEGDSENYKNGDTAIGIDVIADEWHVASIAVSNGKYRVYLDGDYENPIVQGEKVGTGATSVQVTHLPMITGSNSKTNNHSVVTVDNIVAYQISNSFEKKYLPTVTIPETWTKYTAAYGEDGRLTTVAAETVADPSTVDTTGNTAAAKTFVWNSGFQPYAAK